MDDFRPMASGSTIPGNSTVCRTGRMIMASGGSGGCCSPGPAVGCSLCSAMASRLLRQAEQEAAVHQRRSAELPAYRRQGDATLEAPMRDLHPPEDRKST